MIAYADRILHEPGILLRIGMRSRIAEILDVKARDLMSIGPQRAQFQPSDRLRHERERIDADLIEDIFAAECLREEVRNAGQGNVSTKLQRMSFPFAAERLRNVDAALIGAAWSDA